MSAAAATTQAEVGPRPGAAARAAWPALWLALVLVAAKVAHWSLPELSAKRLREWLTDVGVSAHQDVLYALGYGLLGALLLRLARGRPALERWAFRLFLALGFASAAFAIASIQIFAFLRSPLTFALLYLADDMKNMRSSIGAFLSVPVAIALVLVPLVWLWLTLRSLRGPAAATSPRGRLALGLLALLLVGYVAAAKAGYASRWHDRDDHLIARSPHWALVSSVFRELLGRGEAARFEAGYPPELRDDFRPPKQRRSTLGQAPRAKNAILLVLESTGARYLSIYGSPYRSTPNLEREAAHALVLDAGYCHVGMTANSVAALTLSIYPYMTWREYTVEYPRMPGETLAELLKPLGYRTAFVHSGYLEYTNQREFLSGRGFDALREWSDLGKPLVSSWGSDDGALVDGVLGFIDEQRGAPFFVLGWGIMSHHPYEPMPGRPLVDFFTDGPRPEDEWDLGRYLNTLHYVDQQIGRLLDGLRARGLADDTVVLITGDHGEAFGEPHESWGHGARLWQESVQVPFLLWNPRLFPGGGRRDTVAGHVDVNPTLADLLGVPPAASWRGRSLFDPERPPRAYFYAANDDYLLGVREGRFKYVYNATRGSDSLYDLAADPEEQHDVAEAHPELCRTLRQRLAAWRDETSDHLESIRAAGR